MKIKQQEVFETEDGMTFADKDAAEKWEQQIKIRALVEDFFFYNMSTEDIASALVDRIDALYRALA